MNPLIPATAVRLAALGLLAEGPQRYDDVTVAVRRFASRMLGPSLDILGASVEALRAEGLIEGVGARAAPSQSLKGESVVQITPAGRAALTGLLAAPIRGPMTDLARLVIALKLRFFDLMPFNERQGQLDVLIELTEGEIARLADLRATPGTPALLGEWLDHDLAALEARLAWYRARRG